MPTRLFLQRGKTSVQTFSRILCTFGRVFCRHGRTILRRNSAGIMGSECFSCGAWWPLEVKRSALACELDKNAGRAIQQQEVKKLEGQMKFISTIPHD
jgi:hypothetical protein